jgi:hypothetical protein
MLTTISKRHHAGSRLFMPRVKSFLCVVNLCPQCNLGQVTKCAVCRLTAIMDDCEQVHLTKNLCFACWGQMRRDWHRKATIPEVPDKCHETNV